MALRGTIDDFKASVVNDFARPNLFQVDLNFPATLGISSDLSTFGNFTAVSYTHLTLPTIYSV